MNKNITLGIIFFLIIVSTFLNSNLLEGLDEPDLEARIKKMYTDLANRQNKLSKSYEETAQNNLKGLPNLTKLADSFDNIKNSFTRKIDMEIVNILSGYNGADKKDLENLDHVKHYKATKELLQKPENQQLLIICSALHAMSDSKDLFRTKSGSMFDSGSSSSSSNVFSRSNQENENKNENENEKEGWFGSKSTLDF